MKRLLIANRGEIAVRIIRAARELGIESVAIYSDADAGASFVRLADQRIALNGNSAHDTYLNQSKILAAAQQVSADAVHPGYGFFAENAGFANAVVEAGLTFVGPKPETISLMADKGRARVVAEQAKVPLVPGAEAGQSLEVYQKFAEKVGYPVMIKAVAGGSGRGMRVVRSAAELEDRIAEAQKEAQAAFGNDEIFVEKYLEQPRHIEVQVLSDSFGKHLHILERECSVQRRHQKLVEEAPAANLHPELCKRIRQAAVSLCEKVEYEGAGTVEFLLVGGEKADDEFYFLEMNTRIQVEHPVTEMVTGIDLVKQQLLIASGEKISFEQADVCANGHAIEFRVYGEDPSKDFQPKTGEIIYVKRPGGVGVREDSWVEAGSIVSPYYDALLSKLVIWGTSRREAINRAKSQLDEFVVEGMETTLGFHRWLVRNDDFIECRIDVSWIEREYKGEIIESILVGPAVLPPKQANSEHL